MIAPLQILLIEDSLSDAKLIVLELSRMECPIEVERVHTAADMRAALAGGPRDVIVSDWTMPAFSALAALAILKELELDLPFIIVSGTIGEDTAADAMRAGAHDYLLKDRLTRLRPAIDRELRDHAERIERRALEEALSVEKERAQATLDCIGDGVISTDDAENVTFLNVAAETMTGWLRKDAAGQPLANIFRMLRPASIPDFPQSAPGQPQSIQPPVNRVLISREGLEIPIERTIAPIHDRAGRPTGAVVVFRDVSVARAQSLQILHTAEHDFLTGLPNRLLFDDRLAQAIALARRHKHQVAVLFLDLDGFKHINDSLGHPMGDKLLQSVARRLVTCVRASDTVSRQGGDEFVVLLSEIQRPEDAATMATRMMRAVTEAHSIGQHDFHITTSIGLSIYPSDGLDVETLVQNADTAMYQAKENGRRSYQFFKPAMNARAVERQSLEHSLRRALERQELGLHYQPKVNFDTGLITGAEALLRWTHPTRGDVPPGRFISIAEDCGLILSIGSWVLREACKQARAWVDAGLPVATMAVNVSAIEFRAEHFLEDLMNILSDTGLEPSLLELELTESVLMKNAECTASILQRLRAEGIQVAIDDFGTGYSSLSYLRQFPVDALKIDLSFVHEIVTAEDDARIVTAVINMARSLKLRVVAEGVETPQQQKFLRAHHCDEGQGYYFSHPVAAEQFAHLLKSKIPLRPMA